MIFALVFLTMSNLRNSCYVMLILRRPSIHNLGGCYKLFWADYTVSYFMGLTLNSMTDRSCN